MGSARRIALQVPRLIPLVRILHCQLLYAPLGNDSKGDDNDPDKMSPVKRTVPFFSFISPVEDCIKHDCDTFRPPGLRQLHVNHGSEIRAYWSLLTTRISVPCIES